MESNVLFFSAMAVAIPSPQRHVFALAGVVAVPLGNYECYYVVYIQCRLLCCFALRQVRRQFAGSH